MELYRKRLLPEETVKLKDTIVTQNDEIIVTKWEVIHPRPDFNHGCSCYFLKEGFKVSKFIRSDGTLKCWYCDIIKSERLADEDGYVFTDLLADVVIEEGSVQVVDLDELSDAYKQELLTKEELMQALRQLDSLLKKIYAGKFAAYQEMLERIAGM